MTTPDDGEELFALLGTTLRIGIDRLHERLAEAGFKDLRPAHGFAFARLSHDGATASQLGEHLGITKQAAGQMVDYLEQRGYVARVVHPEDGRAKLVVLTDRGRTCIALATKTMDDVARDWSRRTGAEQLAAAREALRAIIADDQPSTGLRPSW